MTRCEFDLGNLVPYLELFHGRGKCRKRLEKLGWAWNPLKHVDAQTWCGWGADGRYHAVVLMEADSTWEAEAAMLAHEAVHVAMGVLDAVGSADEELLAYMVQGASQSMLEAHARWRGGHGRA